MKLVSFSNKRPVADQGSFLTASQTEGKIRITAVVTDSMGVVEGDYVAVGKDQETGKLYVYVGMKDEAKKVQVGNKLISAGQTYEFGSKNAWEEIGGNTDHAVRYEVAAEPIEFDGQKFWELTNPTDLPRIDRKSGASDKDVEDAENAAMGKVEAKEEATAPNVEAEEAGFSLD